MLCVRFRRIVEFVCLLFAASLLASAPANAQGSTYALYVGVAEYQFGAPNYKGGSIQSLGGAPNDVAMIRRAIETRASVKHSDTLLGADATRDAILGALGRYSSGQLGKTGDTLLFYFTGHGALFYDMAGTQAGRFNSTILPYDARNPATAANGDHGDIVDNELRAHIGAIAARGINVVTIFDSCNSGTATRSIPFRKWRSKAAPAVKGTLPQTRSVTTSDAAPAGRKGYVVHLAAAADRSEALENLTDGSYRSDFTVALAKAILSSPAGTTYKELFAAAELQLVQAGLGQQPRAEGDLLTPFLGEAKTGVRIIEATRSADGAYTLNGGSLAGVDPGAKFAFFRSVRDAISRRTPPLAKAAVESADAWEARVRPSLSSADEKLYARLESPSFAAQRLKVTVVTDQPAKRTKVGETLAPFDFIELTDSDPAYMVELKGDTARVVSAFGDLVREVPIADVGDLGTVMEPLARYHALLAMSDKGEKLPVEVTFAETNCRGEERVPVKVENGHTLFTSGDRFHLTMRNNDKVPLYFYLLSLGADYSVDPLDPPNYAKSEPIAAGQQCYQPFSGAAADPGRHHLLLIASEKPLPSLHMLQQGAVRGEAPTDPLERMLVGAASGMRGDNDRAPVSRWGAKLVTYRVNPKQ